MRDSTALVIGAMVLAPLLGPNVALALSTTLGERARKATLKAALTWGGLLALLVALVLVAGRS